MLSKLPYYYHCFKTLLCIPSEHLLIDNKDTELVAHLSLLLMVSLVPPLGVAEHFLPLDLMDTMAELSLLLVVSLVLPCGVVFLN